MVKNLNLRRASTKDSMAIAGIWNHYIEHTDITFNPVPKTPDQIADQIDLHKSMFVAETEKVIAFAHFFPFRNGEGYRLIREHSVYCAPDFMGLGAGHLLMQQLFDHALVTGITSLMAGITASNMASVGFHERLGYKTVGTVTNAGFKFGRYYDLILMQKILTSATKTR